jgi:hypothetical protein
MRVLSLHESKSGPSGDFEGRLLQHLSYEKLPKDKCGLIQAVRRNRYAGLLRAISSCWSPFDRHPQNPSSGDQPWRQCSELKPVTLQTSEHEPRDVGRLLTDDAALPPYLALAPWPWTAR